MENNVRLSVNLATTIYVETTSPFMAYQEAKEWYLKGRDTDEKNHYDRFECTGIQYGTYNPHNKGQKYIYHTINDYNIKDCGFGDLFEVNILLLFDKKMHIDSDNPSRDIYNMFRENDEQFINKDNLVSIEIFGKRLEY